MSTADSATNVARPRASEKQLKARYEVLLGSDFELLQVALHEMAIRLLPLIAEHAASTLVAIPPPPEYGYDDNRLIRDRMTAMANLRVVEGASYSFSKNNYDAPGLFLTMPEDKHDLHDLGPLWKMLESDQRWSAEDFELLMIFCHLRAVRRVIDDLTRSYKILVEWGYDSDQILADMKARDEQIRREVLARQEALAQQEALA